MTRSDELRKRRQRAAYDDYVRLQWQLYRLAHDHPARALLAEAVGLAEQYWRSLMRTLGTSPDVPLEALILINSELARGYDERPLATLEAD